MPGSEPGVRGRSRGGAGVTEAAVRGAANDLALTLFERHQREVYAYLCRLVHDPQWAEDLAQETFVRALKARRQLAQVENHRAWLYRIATNLALNALKRRRRFAWLPWRTADDLRASKGDLAEALSQRHTLEGALAALPPELRAPLLLYAHYGLSVAEVAQVLNLSPGAVKTRLYRARIRFRQAYERGEAR
jgi:RNA polymerase sigma-70 factor (ECF subfamily)